VVESLWFLPASILVACGALAFGLVEIDRSADPDGAFLFSGDASAARTVLSVLAGSLITVSGLALSLMVLVLQLASSQFSPRVLPSFLSDRMTQATVGAFVGIFTFSLIALRSVGSGFVPRLTVTLASGLGILAVILLVGFIHHVSRLIQVSRIAARIGNATLGRVDTLYPAPFGHAAEDDAEVVVARWRDGSAPLRVTADRPGYVIDADLSRLATALAGTASRVHIMVAPGDFVTPADVLVEVWSADLERAQRAACETVSVAGERSPDFDLGFGIRQLADVALRALSPSLNDPTTARTCIGYLRAILERLAERDLPPRVRRFDDSDALIVAARPAFADYLAPVREVGRFAAPSAETLRELIELCESVAERAHAAGADSRADAALAVARAIAGHAEGPLGRRYDQQPTVGSALRGS
jgi:uncharacterized membrane protein